MHTVYLTESPEHTLGEVQLLPSQGDLYKAAEQAEDFDTLDAMRDHQDRLVEEYGQAYRQAAQDVAASRGYQIKVLVTNDGPSEADWDARNSGDVSEETTMLLWQQIHDRIVVTVDVPNGTHAVSTTD